MTKQLVYSMVAAALVALIVVVVGLSLVGSSQPQQSGSNLGVAGNGPVQFQPWNFLQGLFAGTAGQFHILNTGAVSSTATTTIGASVHVGALTEGGSQLTISTTTVLTAAQLCSNHAFAISSTTATTLTLTFPVATATVATANCLTTDGDFFKISLINNTSTIVTLASSTGDKVSLTNTTPLQTFTLGASGGGSSTAVMTITRVNSTTNEYFFSQYGAGQ